MTHRYKRHCYRIADGFRHVESLEITGDQVAAQTGRNGNRADFLELLDKWNRAGVGPSIGHNGLIYVYASEVTSD